MHIKVATWQEYFTTFRCHDAYGSSAFLSLVKDRAEEVRCFVGYNLQGIAALGMICGKRGEIWRMPWSAPWGSVEFAQNVSEAEISEFLAAVAATLAPSPLSITLPAELYPEQQPVVNAAKSLAKQVVTDVNYHYPLSRLADFRKFMNPAARNKYNHALREGFEFTHTTDLARAYAIIQQNRSTLGYYLAMSLEQLQATITQAIAADCFILSHDGEDAAAAIVYRLNSDVAQVIYWGDVLQQRKHRPMNLLPFCVFEYYAQQGFSTVDIGTASLDGVRNEGLCDFKESIGCVASQKFTFVF